MSQSLKFEDNVSTEKRMKAKLIEQYDELVERHASNMPLAWKASVMTACLLSALGSYSCVIAFDIFWHRVSGGFCFFWAEVGIQPKMRLKSIKFQMTYVVNHTEPMDWVDDVVVTYHLRRHCRDFEFVSLISFAVGIVMHAMFTMCGRGGYDPALFFAPWRIAFPGLVICFGMMLLTMSTTHNFINGFLHFCTGLFNLANESLQSNNSTFQYTRPCEAFQVFTLTYNKYNYDTCKLWTLLEYSAWMMTWGWIVSFFILSLRILTGADFQFMKVRIYQIIDNKYDIKTFVQKVEWANMLKESHLKRVFPEIAIKHGARSIKKGIE